ncbi:MAG: ssDNA-binding domain-containing protein [Deltaproteobacteria bacterium]|nr:ssDNA-binding domain-containing protein [Deltaproteobacteria bacterium]
MADSNGQNPSSAPDLYEEIVRDLLESKDAPWEKPWKSMGWSPYNQFSGTVYSGLNRVALAMARPDDPRWLTSWQVEELGYWIKKGQKAKTVEFWVSHDGTEGLSEKDLLFSHGPQSGFETQNDKTNSPVRYYKVFNAAQLINPNGQNLPPTPPRAITWKPDEWVEAIIAGSGVKVVNDQKDRVFYRDNTVHITPKDSFDSTGDYYASIIHELCHWTKTLTGTGELAAGPAFELDYAQEEIRTELATWMLSQDIGLDHDPTRHALYLVDWLKLIKADHQEIRRAALDAELTKKFLLSLAPGPKQMPKVPKLDSVKVISFSPKNQGPKYMSVAPDIFQDDEFPDPPHHLPPNYDFEAEKIPRLLFINRVYQRLLRPGLVMERLNRFKELNDQIIKIGPRHWTRDFDYKRFLQEAQRVAKIQVSLALQNLDHKIPPTQEEVTVYNGVLTLTKAARGLNFKGFCLDPATSDNEPNYRVIHVAKRENQADAPAKVLIDGKPVDVFKEVPPAKAIRRLVLDSESNLVGIFLDANHAQNFSQIINSPKITLLEDRQEAEMALHWRDRLEITVTPKPQIKTLDPKEQEEWTQRLRSRIGVRNPTPTEQELIVLASAPTPEALRVKARLDLERAKISRLTQDEDPQNQTETLNVKPKLF